MQSIKIVSDRVNRLVGRRELRVVLDHPGSSTPSRREVIEKLRELLSLSERQVVIVRKILTEYGLGRSSALVHVYDDPERAKQFEPPHLLRKHGLAEAKDEKVKSSG